MKNIIAQITGIIAIVSTLISVIRETIEAVETPGFGAEKKQAVLDVIGAILDGFPALPVARDTIMGIAGTIIDVLVNIYNVAGKFRKSTDTPTVNPTQGV
jgi:hypothetical protein